MAEARRQTRSGSEETPNTSAKMAEARNHTRSESEETPNASASLLAVSGDVPAPAITLSINWRAAFQSPEFLKELQSAMRKLLLHEALPPSQPDDSVAISGERVEERPSPRIIVEGGAFTAHRNALKPQFFEGIKKAAKEGYRILQQNRTAVDAVEAAVGVLEENMYFNSGRGAFYALLAPDDAEHGGNKPLVQCDAMIMDGHDLNTGAVMTVCDFLHPVSLARKVMEDSPHCALSGEGAKTFAENIGFTALIDPTELVVKGQALGVEQEKFQDFKKYYYKTGAIEEDKKFSTSAAVAIDAKGNMACATSTGGIPGALKGRIGDVPLVGCGGYANKVGAAASSGIGEQIMKVTLAREVVYNMERGQNAQTAAENAVWRMETSVEDGLGGVIAIDKDGNFGKAFNTDVMIWATAKDNTLEFGMERNEVKTEQLMDDY